MALSGSISTSSWSGTNVTCYVTLNWTATQNIENNTSTISWNLTSSVTRGYVTVSELRVKFGDEQIYYRSHSVHTDAYNGTVLVSGTKTITHNTDGTKSFNVSVEAGIYNWAINRSGSCTITLNTIPRSSSITSAANVTLGNACNIKWTPNSSSFKYKLAFSLSSWNYTTAFISPSTTSEYTYTGYTIPNNATLLGLIPSSTTSTMSVKLMTYNTDGTQIGSTSAAKTFTVTVPNTVVPSVGTITLDPVDINGQNILVQGKNKITVSVSGCSAGTGSSIKSYTFSGPGISYTGTSTSTTSSSTISNAGTLKYTVTVTDNRGRSASTTANITCYEYSAPYFKSFNAYRVGSKESTVANNSGTYANCEFEVAYASVNGTNDVTVKVYYKKNELTSYTSVDAITDSKNTSGNKIISDISLESTYTVYAIVTDNYSGTSTSTIITVFNAERILNIKANGKGIGVGKMAETDNLLDVKWPIKTEGSFVAKEPTELYKSAGSAGTITLNYSVSDYTYIEIFYMDESSNGLNSIKVYNPNNKKIDLSIVGAYDSDVKSVYIRCTRYTISASTITPSSSTRMLVGSSGVTNASTGSYIKITRIVGYK